MPMLLPALSNLEIGCSQRKRPRRGAVQHEQDTTASDLEAIEKDSQGQIVYVDVGSTELLSILQARLNSIRPTASELQRLPLINQSRVLVEIEDAMGLNIFQMWIQNTLQLNSATGRALRELLGPLGPQLLLLGAHFICPRITEYEPRVRQQTPHTDVGARGEVIGVGLHTEGDPMRTLLDPCATIASDGTLQDGEGFRRANTPAFAFDTGTVHAGPGIAHVPGPYPRFLTDRVFFLVCSAELPLAQVAKHRADNGLVGRANLSFGVPIRM